MLAAYNSVQWPAWLVALVYGLASALSFPIGSAWGAFSTAAPRGSFKLGHGAESRWSAGTLAFGAGCLLFAVTVEIYGEAVVEMETVGYLKEIPSISVTIMSAMLGAWVYIAANRWIVRVISEGPEAPSATPDEETHLIPADEAHGPSYDQGIMRSVSPTTAEARKKSLLVGYASWFGVLVSGIPEGVLLGQLVAVGHPSPVLVISLFISNYPTAFASASMMKQGGKGNAEIIGLWALVFIMTGLFAALLPICMPSAMAKDTPVYVDVVGDVLEGLAGGSMLASILALMLPEAYNILGDLAGLMATGGFFFAVALKVFGGLIDEFTVETTAMAAAKAVGRAK